LKTMATINTLFLNALANMHREELIQHLANQLSDTQIKKILIGLHDNVKMEILESRFNEKIGNLVSMMATVGERIIELKEEQLKEQDLQMLDGRILLSKLIQKMALNKEDKKLLTETNDNLSRLFTEYRMQGGKKSYYSFDVKRPEVITEEFLLHKYWTSEMLDTYRKMNAITFVKWNIPEEDAKFYLGDIGFDNLNKSEEKKRFFFYNNYFVLKLIRSGAFVYGIGTDQQRREFPDKILKYSGGIKN
jgi:hypothetical protein